VYDKAWYVAQVEGEEPEEETEGFTLLKYMERKGVKEKLFRVLWSIIFHKPKYILQGFFTRIMIFKGGGWHLRALKDRQLGIMLNNRPFLT